MLKANNSPSFSLSFLKDSKVLSGIVFLVILIILPILLFEVKTQQKTQQNATTQTWQGGLDTCRHVKVAFVNENPPACQSGSAVTDTYSTTVVLTSNDGGTWPVVYLFESFWCKDASELGDGVNPSSCIQRVKLNTNPNNPVTVGPGSSQTVTSSLQTASSYGFGAACGIFQTDFSFKIAGTSCFFGYSALDKNPQHPVLAAGYCPTNQTCQLPTSTPTETPAPLVTILPPTSTPTPTQVPTDTVAPSDTVVPPTDTPTDVPTDTPADTPTGTLTPTNTPTDTPTNNPTATPTVPGTTPIPTEIAAAPTLPPTGPGSTLVSIGLVGVAISVLGVALLLGF